MNVKADTSSAFMNKKYKPCNDNGVICYTSYDNYYLSISCAKGYLEQAMFIYDMACQIMDPSYVLSKKCMMIHRITDCIFENGPLQYAKLKAYLESEFSLHIILQSSFMPEKFCFPLNYKTLERFQSYSELIH